LFKSQLVTACHCLVGYYKYKKKEEKKKAAKDLKKSKKNGKTSDNRFR
jgi:hypothetical protein